MATSGADGLAVIEGMLRDIGAPSPAQQVKEHHKFATAAAAKRNAAGSASGATAANQQKDCLAAESRQAFQTPKFETRSPSLSKSPSLMKGAHMAGKDPEHLRFYGKGFEMPPRESPGPIYQPREPDSGLNQGRSFPKAPRMRDSPSALSSASSGPNTTLPGTIGPQVESHAKTAPVVSFTKGKRFNEKEFISRAHGPSGSSDTPAPTAYQPDILRLTEKGQGISFSGSRSVPTNKIFISRAHVVDCIGSASPGPCYNPEEAVRSQSAFAVLDSRQKRGPAFSFGRSSGPRSVEEVESEEAGGTRPHSVQPFISREHSKSTPTLESPGPAAYSPKVDATKRNPVAVSFCRDHGTDKRFISKELSTMKGKDSPGPKYFYTDDAVRKASPVASLGAKTGEPSTSDRFANNVFIGKGMGEVPGNASPGPAYYPEVQDKGPSYSITFKERHFPKSIFPGPSRARFIMKDLAKENMGAYSPGPKYDISTKQFGKDAPAVSFGVSDRYFGEGFSAEHRAKFGTAEKPYTCPAEARFVSIEFSKSAMAGKCSSGPKYSPKDELCSWNKRAPAAVISPEQTVVPRKPHATAEHGGAGDGEQQQKHLLQPKYDAVSPDRRAHAFPKAERMPSPKHTQGPSPTTYNPKFDLIEKRVAKDVHIGELAGDAPKSVAAPSRRSNHSDH